MSDLSDDEALAAEYALGTLDRDERIGADRRRETDDAFAKLIGLWESRLAPLDTALPEITPPDDLWPDLLRRLPAVSPEDGGVVILALRRRLKVWRGVASVASALAAALAAWVAVHGVEAITPVPQRYVAVLQQGADRPSFVLSLDTATRKMTVVPLSTTAPAGRSYELWVIGDDAKPRSMGLVDTGGPVAPRMPDMPSGAMRAATYAVTVEPAGGSPTGQPTTTPVFVGKMVNTTL